MSGEESVSAGLRGTVLVVGDSRRASRTAAVLDSADSTERLSIVADPTAAIERLSDADCVVCEVGADGFDANGFETDALQADAFDADEIGTALRERGVDGDRSDDVSDGEPIGGVIGILRSHAPELPIIALVSNDGASEALTAGATDVIAPEDPESVVVSRVWNAVCRSRLARRSATPPTSSTSGSPSGSAATGPSPATSATDLPATPETPTDADGFRSLLDATSRPVLVVGEDHTFAWGNAAVESWTGFTPGELEGTAFSRLVHPVDRDAVRSTLATVTADGLDATESVDCRLRRADDTWRRATLAVRNRLSDPTIGGAVITVESGFSRGADGALDVLDRVRHPVFALDADWTITTANEATEALLGRPATDLRGIVLWDLLPDSVVGEWYERLDEAVATTSPVEFEVDHPTADGVLTVRADPADAGVTVSARERRGSESALDGQRFDRFESVLDAIAAPVFVVEDGSVAFANAATFELVDDDGVVGRPLDSLFDPDLAARLRERASSRVRLLDPIEWSVDRDGHVAHLAITVVPLGEEGATCIVRDVTDRHRLERSLSSLSSLADALLESETTTGLCETVVEATRDVLGAEHVVWYRADAEAYRPVAVASNAASPVEPPAFEPHAFDRLGLGRDGDGRDDTAVMLDPVRDLSLHELASDTERAIVVPVREFGLLLAIVDVGSTAGRALAAGEAVAALASFGLDRIERESDRRHRDREFADLRARLDRLSSVLGRRRDLERLLVEPTDRETLERRVCERLSELDAVELAWIGEPRGVGEVVPRARAGSDEAYLDDVGLYEGAGSPEPVVRAVNSREPVRVDAADRDAIGDRGTGGDWRRVARDHGFLSIVAVPLVHDGFVYGAFGVYSTQSGTFDEETFAVLEDFGRTLALAIDAREAKRGLLADEVVELELALGSNTSTLLSSIAREANCELVLETVVPSGDDRSTVYFRARGGTATDLLDALEASERVRSASALAHDADEMRFEAVVEGPTVAEVLIDHGGILRRIDAVDDRTSLLVELPSGRNVRSFVSTLEETFPDIELVARRGRRRCRRDSGSFRTDLEARLTDRQLDALRAAYFGGFFEWPRDRTGEEVAETLGISQPTFNRHFRSAERTLYEFLFDEA